MKHLISSQSYMKYLQVSFVLAWAVVLLLLSMLSFLLEYPKINISIKEKIQLTCAVLFNSTKSSKENWPYPNLFMRQTKLGKLSS